MEGKADSFRRDAAQRQRARANLTDSIILAVAVGALLAAAGWFAWGWGGIIASVLGIGLIFAAAQRVAPEGLMRLYQARPIEPDRDRQLLDLLNVVSYRAGLRFLPDLYIVPSLTLTAFSSGSPDHRSVIAVTEGLLRRLTMRETAGVLAHEVSHIRNDDLSVFGIADVMTRVAQLMSYVALALAIANLIAAFSDETFVSWWTVLLLYLAPAVSSLLQLGLSRTREFDADREAAMLTGDPMGLASALSRLEVYTGHIVEELLYPVPARRVPQPSVLRSHPPSKDRIARLLAIDTPAPVDPIVIVEQPMVSLVGFGPIEMRPRYRWPGLWF